MNHTKTLSTWTKQNVCEMCDVCHRISGSVELPNFNTPHVFTSGNALFYCIKQERLLTHKTTKTIKNIKLQTLLILSLMVAYSKMFRGHKVQYPHLNLSPKCFAMKTSYLTQTVPTFV